MPFKSIDILKEINRLISLIGDSTIQETDKLKIMKVLLVVKLKLIELLGKEISSEAKVIHIASMASHESKYLPDKQELILEFIKNKNGRVGLVDLLGLGIAGRSLRRYLKRLKDNKKIRIEKRGRENFYTVIA